MNKIEFPPAQIFLTMSIIQTAQNLADDMECMRNGKRAVGSGLVRLTPTPLSGGCRPITPTKLEGGCRPIRVCADGGGAR